MEVGGCAEDLVEVELELEEEDDDEDEEEVEDDDDGEGLMAVVLELLEVVDGAAHDSVSLVICAPAGSSPAGTGICDTGVPGATLALKLKLWPP